MAHYSDFHQRYMLIIKHLSEWWKDGVKLLAWNLSLPLIDPLCCCAPFTACGSPAHPLMSSSCLLLLVINDCGPGRSSPAGQKTSPHDLRLHANLSCCGEERLSLSFLSRPVGFAGAPMMVQLICLPCFSSYMQRKRLPNEDLLVVTVEVPSWWPTGAPLKPKNKALWTCNTATLCNTA